MKIKKQIREIKNNTFEKKVIATTIPLKPKIPVTIAKQTNNNAHNIMIKPPIDFYKQ